MIDLPALLQLLKAKELWQGRNSAHENVNSRTEKGFSQRRQRRLGMPPHIFFISLVPFTIRHHANTLANSLPGGYETSHIIGVTPVTSSARCGASHIIGVTRNESVGSPVAPIAEPLQLILRGFYRPLMQG
jgi:hypothetical protein